MKKTVITISRQYGSGGGYIGERLAEELGIPCYDKQLFIEAANRSGIQSVFYEEAERRGFDWFSHMYDTGGATSTSLGEYVFLKQVETIRSLANEGPCIIVGRGGVSVPLQG